MRLAELNGPDDLKRIPLSEMPELADEIRQVLVSSVARTGGHLASNLGVVELTLALHYVFSSPRDKIIWDVGHQSYVHKMLTGRANQMATLRQHGGMSGFPKPEESPHDAFATGHSSTSISAAMGMAVARDLRGEDYDVVAVIGDGALTAGMAFEALNHAGHLETRLIVVLNDNEMSISPNVGGLARHLSRLRTNPGYFRRKERIGNTLKRIPRVGPFLADVARSFKDAVKYMVVPGGVLFEELGITYLGPIDGHNVTDLVAVLEQARRCEGPVLVHVITKKGKGYAPALSKPDEFHGIGPFDISTGKLRSTSKTTYTQVFGEKLVEMAARDDRIVAITAAMTSGTGLSRFARLYPERFFDVGICEQHAVTLAAGMAMRGLRPVVAVYSTFLQRAFDQVVHDVCLQNLPVVFAIDRAGLVGEDGPTHHGVFDLSYLRPVPNMTIMCPSSAGELRAMLELAGQIDGPVAIRYPRGAAATEAARGLTPISLGRGRIIRHGSGIALIAVGSMVENALLTAGHLESYGVNATVVDARFVKPLDTEMLENLAEGHDRWVLMEENVAAGGFCSAVAEWLCLSGRQVQLMPIALPDYFIEHGKVQELRQGLGLAPDEIASRILARWPAGSLETQTEDAGRWRKIGLTT